MDPIQELTMPRWAALSRARAAAVRGWGTRWTERRTLCDAAASGKEAAATAASGKEAAATAAAGATNNKSRGPFQWKSVVLLLGTGGGVLASYEYEKRRKLGQLQQRASQQQSSGTAMIGGDFSLVGADGRRVSNVDLRGKFPLYYFGFTFCPDICPDELEKIAEAVEVAAKTLGKEDAQLIQPVFISIDPERDTPKKVGEYVKEFSPRLIGLTGSVEEVKSVAKLFRVYYTKTSDDKDYLVDHSIIHYLMNPDGSFNSFFGKKHTVGEIADALVAAVREYKSQASK